MYVAPKAHSLKYRIEVRLRRLLILYCMSVSKWCSRIRQSENASNLNLILIQVLLSHFTLMPEWQCASIWFKLCRRQSNERAVRKQQTNMETCAWRLSNWISLWRMSYTVYDYVCAGRMWRVSWCAVMTNLESFFFLLTRPAWWISRFSPLQSAHRFRTIWVGQGVPITGTRSKWFKSLSPPLSVISCHFNKATELNSYPWIHFLALSFALVYLIWLSWPHNLYNYGLI